MKKRIFVPGVYWRLEGVLTDQFMHFFRRLVDEYGFTIIGSPNDMIDENEKPEVALIFACVHGKQLLYDSLKFERETKIILYLGGMHSFGNSREALKPVMERADKVLSGCDSSFRAMWPEYVDKHEFFPNFFAPHGRYSNLGINKKPLMKCLLSGAMNPKIYPLRNYIKRQAENGYDRFIDILEHPRWDKGNVINESYARRLNDYFCAVATSSRFRYALAKYFEIPAAGSLLLADEAEDVKKAGLEAWEHYVPINTESAIGQIKDCIESPEGYELIRKSGREYVLWNHSVENRVQRFGRILEELG